MFGRNFLISCSSIIVFSSLCNQLPVYAQSSSVIRFCNGDEDRQAVYASYLSYDAPNGWQSHGWYKVDHGKCRNVNIGRPYNGDIFIYAEDQDGSAYGRNGTSFCVDDKNEFTIPNSDQKPNCTGQYKRVTGSKFSISSGVNTWTFGDKAAINNKIQFPIRADAKKEIADGINMEAWATVLENGQVNGEAHTWTNNKLQGAHALAAVILYDENKQPIWSTGTQQCGVAGRLDPSGPSNRRCTISATVPTQILQKTKYIGIALDERSGNDLADWLINTPEGRNFATKVIMIAVGAAL